jgi:release factor glutamine methyltransferase
MATVRQLLATADVPGESGRLDAELLLSHALEQPRSYLYAWPEQEVAPRRRESFKQMLDARRAGQPVAYLLGEREFWSLPLRVSEHTLIPRPETETLVEWALELALPAAARVSDWGTGSGAVALALASERPTWQLLATDISADALSVARDNARQLKLGNVEFLQSDWEAGLVGLTFDLIISNPPYVAESDPHLTQGDPRFEPIAALRSGPDGLDALRCIIAAAPNHLGAGGWLLLEHGFDQAQAVCQLLQAAGFSAIGCRQDLAAVDRVSGGMWSA